MIIPVRQEQASIFPEIWKDGSLNCKSCRTDAEQRRGPTELVFQEAVVRVLQGIRLSYAHDCESELRRSFARASFPFLALDRRRTSSVVLCTVCLARSVDALGSACINLRSLRLGEARACRISMMRTRGSDATVVACLCPACSTRCASG